jgi:hypothetical protein
MYKKHETNLPQLINMTDPDKDKIAQEISRVARKLRIPIQTCGNEVDYSCYGIEMSGCVTLDILGKANEIRFRNLKHFTFLS